MGCHKMFYFVMGSYYNFYDVMGNHMLYIMSSHFKFYGVMGIVSPCSSNLNCLIAGVT